MDMKVIELTTPLTTAQVEAAEDGIIDVRLPATRMSWDLLEALCCGPCTLVSADGDAFIGDVFDWDEYRYTVHIELR